MEGVWREEMRLVKAAFAALDCHTALVRLTAKRSGDRVSASEKAV
jgi:hypothetical protein